ncbi:MAG: glycosyl hydrolase family 8, partial [Cytophagaceae bacterium]
MRKIYFLSFLLGLIGVLAMQDNLMAQSYPFPQNVEYTYGTMPTNRNSNHAMQAYESWKQNYVTSSGACGRRRVIFDYFPGTTRGAEDRSMTVSEGIAYGMLLSAYAADRPLFDDLWAYYRMHRNGNGVMNWKIQNCSPTHDGRNGATDAELDVAMSLIVASYQWQSDAYLNDARNMIRVIRQHQFEGTVLKPGDMFGGNSLTNPSYFSPGYYRVFARYDTGHETFWTNAAARGYQIIEAAGGTTGLVPDWCRADGNYSGEGSHYEAQGRDFIFDAIRTPFRSAIDYLWHGTPAARAYCERITTWLRAAHNNDPYQIGSRYGTRISTAGAEGQKIGHQHLNNTFLGCFAIGTMAADGLGGGIQTFVDNMYNANRTHNPGHGEYFNMTIKTIALFVQTGNFYLPPPDQCDGPDLGADRSLCQGSPLVLNANIANRTYTWRRNNVVLNGQTNQTLSVTTPGEYEVIARDNDGCTRRSRVNVYAAAIVPDFSFQVAASRIRLTNTSTGGISDYSWELDGIPFSDEMNAETDALAEGAYEVTLKINNSGFGCAQSAELTRTIIVGDGVGWAANEFNDNDFATPWIGSNGYAPLPRIHCSREDYDLGGPAECMNLPCGMFEVNVTGGGQYDPFGVNFRDEGEDVFLDLREVPYVSFKIKSTADLTLGVGLNDGSLTTHRITEEITAGDFQEITIEFPPTSWFGWTTGNPNFPVDFTNIHSVQFFPMETDPTFAGTITIEWIVVGGVSLQPPSFNLATDEDGFPVYNADGVRYSTWTGEADACDGEATVRAEACTAEEIRWFAGTNLIGSGEEVQLAPGTYFVHLINQGGVTIDTIEVRGANLTAGFTYSREDNGMGLRLYNNSTDFDTWVWSYGAPPIEPESPTWEEGYHYYEEEGEYEVCVSVTNATCGTTEQHCEMIEITCYAPMPDVGIFSISVGTIEDDTVTTCHGTEITFTIPEVDNADNYGWFGIDGTNLSATNSVTATFTESQWMKVEAYNMCGETVKDSVYVNVLPELVAEFTFDQIGDRQYEFEATWVGDEGDVDYNWYVDG